MFEIEMIEAATLNLKSLGFTSHQVILSCAPISQYSPPIPPNLIFTNPPYGIRMGILLFRFSLSLFLSLSYHREMIVSFGEG
jgi:23S rRNA G2445 N2-methylase RlmL